MSTAIDRASLPRLEDYPIPEDIQPDRTWSEQMLEMAAHIGAATTLRILAAYGGQMLYYPRDPERSPFARLLTPQQAAKLGWVYGYTRLRLPVARTALARARRGALIASVRAGTLSRRDAAIILGTTRGYLADLLARPDEDGVPIPMPKCGVADERQISIFDILPD